MVRLVGIPEMGRQDSRDSGLGAVLLAGLAYRAGVTGKAGVVRVCALDDRKRHRAREHTTDRTHEADSDQEPLASIRFNCSVCSIISSAEPTTYNSNVASLCFAR